MTDTIEQHIENLDCEGYTIIVDAFDTATAQSLRDDIVRLEHELQIKPGTNGFEGHHRFHRGERGDADHP